MNQQDIIKQQILNVYKENPDRTLIQFLIELDKDNRLKQCQPSQVAATLAAMIRVK